MSEGEWRLTSLSVREQSERRRGIDTPDIHERENERERECIERASMMTLLSSESIVMTTRINATSDAQY